MFVLRGKLSQKAIRFHPDKCRDPRTVIVFQAVQGAFNTLGDEAKRREYDVQGFLDPNRQFMAERLKSASKSGVVGASLGGIGLGAVGAVVGFHLGLYIGVPLGLVRGVVRGSAQARQDHIDHGPREETSDMLDRVLEETGRSVEKSRKALQHIILFQPRATYRLPQAETEAESRTNEYPNEYAGERKWDEQQGGSKVEEGERKEGQNRGEEAGTAENKMQELRWWKGRRYKIRWYYAGLAAEVEPDTDQDLDLTPEAHETLNGVLNMRRNVVIDAYSSFAASYKVCWDPYVVSFCLFSFISFRVSLSTFVHTHTLSHELSIAHSLCFSSLFCLFPSVCCWDSPMLIAPHQSDPDTGA